ncbi:WD40-repeat-containing domain protein [Zopfochytrium polystomum]|nr:WD40-repeat-containing domain protein [Zopfochytrium polystomum]
MPHRPTCHGGLFFTPTTITVSALNGARQYMPRERISNRAALWKSRQQASQTLRNALLSSASTDESRSQFSRNHVSKERVAELWEIVRSKFLHKSPKLFDLLLSARSIPYAITIRQGFQFLFKLRLRFLVKCVAMHRLVPRHLTESGVIHPNQKKLNRVRSEETDSSSDDETKKGSDDNEGDDRHGERLGPALAPVTFVCACSSKTVRVWDVTRKVSVHPRLSQKIQADIQHIAFVSKFAFYACCGGDKTLHLFNARFEWMHDIVVPVHIQHLRYNETMNELLVIGTHDILMFSLDCIVAKGVPRVYLNLRRQSSTRLPLEEWITCIALDSNQHRLYAAVGSKILSFNLVTGDLTDKWANVSHRQVTSIVHFAAYDYTVLGCSNGRIKIINMTSLIVHEFASHTKKITALAVYPHGSFVLSASLDYTVRMFCLKTFQEVYCLNLKEQPISLEIIDGARLYIGSRDSVNVWSLNPINTSCSTTNTSVVNLAYSKSRKIPGRAIVQSEDGTTRIISPSTGKLITTLLPLLEVDRFRDTVHSSKIERLFLLTEAHEIWTVATDINPCVVIDIWAANQGDELQKLALFDGRLTDEEKKLKRNADIPDDFVLLLSGTKGGQIIVYDTVGNTAEYFQLHFGRITFMSVEAKRRLLVTAGEDNVVQLCQLHPLSREFIKIRVTITLKAIPRFASLIEDRICVASDDFSICNFKFDLDKRESKITVGHGRSDDHTDAILSLFSFPKVGIFVSSSKDNTIRVWDIYSTLLREVQFSEPIRGLCPAAKCGDLLIGLNNRIDTVKYGNYLPPSYVRMVQKMTWKPSIAEQPKKFDEAFNFLENHNVHRRVMDDNRLFSLAHPTLDIFGRSNFVKVAKLHTLKKAPSLAWGSKKAAEEDQRHEILQIRLRKLFEERQAKIAALKEQANEGL